MIANYTFQITPETLMNGAAFYVLELYRRAAATAGDTHQATLSPRN